MSATPGPAPRRAGRALGSLVLLAVSLAVTAVAVEVGVRVLLDEQVKFPRHVVGADFGLRINEPDQAYRHKSADVTVRFRINGQGMRADRDYAYAKPPGIQRIVSLGDSFTVGYEVEVDQTFSSALERELSASGVQVEVLNAGVSGYSTAEACLYVERELWRYDPDLVLISFYGNDLVDNVRTDLFGLEDGRLIERRSSYVPGGGLGNFLNTNWAFNLLSERSDAFVFLKERLTRLLKAQMVERNLENLERAEREPSATSAAPGEDGPAYQERLAAAILERLYAVVRERGAALVIQSIPAPRSGQKRLVEQFPLAAFDVDREALAFLPAREVLEPWVGRELLYHERSHWHWTPHSHAVAGRALAELILERRLLDVPSGAAAPPITDPAAER